MINIMDLINIRSESIVIHAVSHELTRDYTISASFESPIFTSHDLNTYIVQFTADAREFYGVERLADTIQMMLNRALKSAVEISVDSRGNITESRPVCRGVGSIRYDCVPIDYMRVGCSPILRGPSSQLRGEASAHIFTESERLGGMSYESYRRPRTRFIKSHYGQSDFRGPSI